MQKYPTNWRKLHKATSEWSSSDDLISDIGGMIQIGIQLVEENMAVTHLQGSPLSESEIGWVIPSQSNLAHGVAEWGLPQYKLAEMRQDDGGRVWPSDCRGA